MTALVESPRARGRGAARWGGAAAPLVVALSGAAALAWQVVWTAQLGAGLGHEIVAVLAVLAAFFGGLALGAHALSRAIAACPRPGRWYAGCEGVVAMWGLGLSFAMPALMNWSAGLIGAEPSAAWHWTVAFFLPLLLLLPASAAMGATLPALERQLRTTHSHFGGLYAANTLGAVVGLLLAVFVLMPVEGLQRTAWMLAGVNAFCAVLAWRLWGAARVAVAEHTAAAGAARSSGLRVACLLAITGLLGIGYEVLAVRVLSQVTENTVYSYALLLAMYLLGTAAGAALYQRYLRRRATSAEAAHSAHSADEDRLRDRLLRALALAVLLSGLGLAGADWLCAWPARWLGLGAAGALAGEALAAAAAMWAPTLVMGALFTHLCLQAQSSGWPLGRAVALNTVGAAIAPVPIGVWLVPALGPRAGLGLLVMGYLLLQAPTQWRRPDSLGLGALACALALWAAPLRFVDVPEDGRVLSYRDGVMAAVSVVQDGQGVARLRINNRAQEGSSASGAVEWRLAQLPLLLHPAPRQALMLGLGTGFTAAAASQEDSLHVDAVELLPEVVAASALFASVPQAPRPVQAVRTVVADARRFVQAPGARYDVIVADLFHPARSGAGALYTVEQFHAVRERLAPGGLFCQWLALHQMDIDTLRSITAAFLRVYPRAYAVLAGNSLDTPVLGLIAQPDAAGIDLESVRSRLAQAAPATRRAAHLEDEYAVVGSVLAGPAALTQFAAGAPANTDDHPTVNHRAPWATYAPQSRPRDRLLSLVAELQPQTGEVLLANEQLTEQHSTRLQAYWTARRRYIELGAATSADADPAVMLQRVQAPLLGLLRASPEFRPACEPLLTMARALQTRDAARAREVLGALDAVQARCVLPAPTFAASLASP